MVTMTDLPGDVVLSVNGISGLSNFQVPTSFPLRRRSNLVPLPRPLTRPFLLFLFHPGCANCRACPHHSLVSSACPLDQAALEDPSVGGGLGGRSPPGKAGGARRRSTPLISPLASLSPSPAHSPSRGCQASSLLPSPWTAFPPSPFRWSIFALTTPLRAVPSPLD
jgi:hypothetical protein